MAGIGVRLNRIFEKNSIACDLIGILYSAVVTIAPMLAMITTIFIMGRVLGFDSVNDTDKQLFSCMVLYIFVFGMITVSPFNAVLSKYMSDVIFEERYEDILPCYHLGLLMCLILGCGIGVPFCVCLYHTGVPSVFFVLMSFWCFISLLLAVYSMGYLSICKDYEKIALFFIIGMVFGFILSCILHFMCGQTVINSMFTGLTSGIFLISILEFSFIKCYFKQNSHHYRRIFDYFLKYWPLVLANFLYVIGMYIHNFVFWVMPGHDTFFDIFVCYQDYDIAACLAMFTNLSATVIFVTHMEMHFHNKYKSYFESIIGAKKLDIDNDKSQMFRQMARMLQNLVRVQFIVSVIFFLLFMLFLPELGISDRIMRIYPSLASGYFILFLMYSAILFLYYFSDTKGMILTTGLFFIVTLVTSIGASYLSDTWKGLGLIIGSFVGWTVAYLRLYYLERHMDEHIFCNGYLINKGRDRVLSNKVYDKTNKKKLVVGR